MAKEVAKTSEHASYDLGVQEIEVYLVEELVEVCRDYYKEVWTEALNLVGVHIAFEWRKAENIYYLMDIHEVLVAFPLNATHAPTSSEQ